MHAEAREPFWSSFSAAVCALLLFSIVSIGSAADHHSKQSDDFWEKYDDITDWVTLRLQLTPQQEDKVLPLMENSFSAQLAVLREYGVSPENVPKLNREQREEIDAKIIVIRANTRAEMVKVLNAQQLEELKEIQREFHEEFRRWLSEHE